MLDIQSNPPYDITFCEMQSWNLFSLEKVASFEIIIRIIPVILISNAVVANLQIKWH